MDLRSHWLALYRVEKYAVSEQLATKYVDNLEVITPGGTKGTPKCS